MKDLNRSAAGLTPQHPVKVLQFGKGNFLRAFSDWMIDILNEKTGFDGSVQIVQANSRESDDDFRNQDHLYHVVVNGMQNGKAFREIRLISCVDSLINPYDDFPALLRAAENPGLAFIFSNTTEAGIRFDDSDRDPKVMSRSFPGTLTSLLFHRYTFFRGEAGKGLTVLPCELIEKNGEALRETIYQYARHWGLEPAFADWVRANILFCNTLVDRIVPGYPRDEADALWKKTGYKDQRIVMAEPYHLLVIEPVDASEKSVEALRKALPLEQAGLNVIYTGDLRPYRERKVRILNGAHTCMVPVAYLRGLRTVKETIDDPFTGEFVRGAIREEIIPTLDPDEPALTRFADDVIERFQNPFIRHELRSIALNSVSKFKVRVLPSLLGFKEKKGALPDRLVLSLAALILFYRGSWKGEATPVNDTPAVLQIFTEAWKTGDYFAVAGKVLSSAACWGIDLTKIPGLHERVAAHMKDLSEG